MSLNTTYKSRGHVATYFLYGVRSTFMDQKIVFKPGQRRSILALGGKEHLRGIEIDENADVVVATPTRGFIDTNLSDPRKIGFLPRLLHIMIEDPPQASVMLVDDTGQR